MYMLTFILSSVFSLLLIYVFVLSGWIDTWIHAPLLPEGNSEPKALSVIIPFRNESLALNKNIENIIAEVNAEQHAELIFVNDHSDDDSVRIIEKFLNDKVRLIHASNYGKKNAVREGVEASRYDYVLTLDADIEVPHGWIHEVIGQTKSNGDLIILPLEVKPNERSFGFLQAMEFLSLYAVTGATAMSKYPMMCNGAHLLFAKTYYNKNIDKLRFDISSGDDMFLMEAAERNDRVLYANTGKLIVSMDAEESLMRFVMQRIRWSGKTLHLKSVRTKAFGLLVIALQIAFWFLVVLALNWKFAYLFLICFFLIKSIFDIMLINAASTRTGRQFSLYYCVLLALVYPLYGLFIPVLGVLMRPRWKGRIIKT